jgi:hypothetical protein
MSSQAQGAAILLFLAFLYCVPFLIAHGRQHKNVTPIFFLNLLLGWTFLGWVVALIWSFTAQEQNNKNS